MCNNKRCLEHLTKKILSYFLDVSQTLARARYGALSRNVARTETRRIHKKKLLGFFESEVKIAKTETGTTLKTCE